jgi:hypothetical protein
MTTYRLTPVEGAPVLRQARSIERATARGLLAFPAGLRSVEPVGLAELAELAANGVPLPLEAQRRVAVHNAVQKERAKANARVLAVRDKVREEARVKKVAQEEEEKARREALKAEAKAWAKAEKEAEKRQNRKDTKKAAAEQTPSAMPVEPIDNERPPWED